MGGTGGEGEGEGEDAEQERKTGTVWMEELWQAAQ